MALMRIYGLAQSIQGVDFCPRGDFVEGVLVRSGQGKGRRVPLFALKPETAIDGTSIVVFHEYLTWGETRIVQNDRYSARVQRHAAAAVQNWCAKRKVI